MYYDYEEGATPTELSCAACGHPVASDRDDIVRCPNCDEHYSLTRHEGFAMMETDGWVARISIEPAVEAVPGLAN